MSAVLVQIGSTASSLTSLLPFCQNCEDTCCNGRTGRTLMTAEERQKVLASGHIDYTVPWDSGWNYLRPTVCEYLHEGKCSIHSVKPFACRVFPFVPRIIANSWWLFLVSSCPASMYLQSEFKNNVLEDAKRTLSGWDPQLYERYWRENKVKDFRSDRILSIEPVFPDLIVIANKEMQMKIGEVVQVPGCVGTTIEHIAKESDCQILQVSVEDGGQIPLHSHHCAATMIVLRGEARALGKDEKLLVKTGDVIVKKPQEPHGFAEPAGGFSFLSISSERGILTDTGWDLHYLDDQASL